MQTLQLTITLPDLIQFEDRDALQMQVLFVESLVASGRINLSDSTQRNAVLEWYQKIVPYIQPITVEYEPKNATLSRDLLNEAKTSNPAAEELIRDTDAEMDRLTEENGWTAETFEQWGREHLRTPYERR